MQKVLRAAITLSTIFASTTATIADDCQCDQLADRYIEFVLLNEVEIDEASWRLVEAEVKIDMTSGDELQRCFVQLQMVEHYEKILYQEPFQEVPPGEFEIYFTGSWMLVSEVEKVLSETECFTHQ